MERRRRRWARGTRAAQHDAATTANGGRNRYPCSRLAAATPQPWQHRRAVGTDFGLACVIAMVRVRAHHVRRICRRSGVDARGVSGGDMGDLGTPNGQQRADGEYLVIA